MYGSGLTGIGTSFQPGANDQNGQSPNGGAYRPGGSGVQEAIRILSLRLPRVVGAQGAIAAAPLLNSQGSAGNPMIDSVLQRAWQRVFPTGPDFGTAPAAPVLPAGGSNDQPGPAPNFGPQFYGTQRQAPSIDRREATPNQLPTPRVPRIIPGGGQEPPLDNPVTETPLPAPAQPPAADPLPSDALWADLRGRGFPV